MWILCVVPDGQSETGKSDDVHHVLHGLIIVQMLQELRANELIFFAARQFCPRVVLRFRTLAVEIYEILPGLPVLGDVGGINRKAEREYWASVAAETGELADDLIPENWFCDDPVALEWAKGFGWSKRKLRALFRDRSLKSKEPSYPDQGYEGSAKID